MGTSIGWTVLKRGNAKDQRYVWEKCSLSSTIRETQIKTPLRPLTHPSRTRVAARIWKKGSYTLLVVMQISVDFGNQYGGS